MFTGCVYFLVLVLLLLQVPTSLVTNSNQGANDVYSFDNLAPTNSLQSDVYEFDKLGAPKSSPQNDIYNFDKLSASKTSPQNDTYSFDKLTATAQSPHSKFPSTTSNRAKVPASQGSGDYSFDQLAPPTPLKKSSGSSSSVKEDMHHVQFKRPEEQSDYGFDHLNMKKDQRKTGYDTVPPPVRKSPSPLNDEDQEEYIEPIDQDVLKEIKEEHQTYDQLQTHDYIPGPPSSNANQAPPKLPAKKKSFPVHGSSYDLLGSDESCLVDEKVQ